MRNYNIIIYNYKLNDKLIWESAGAASSKYS